MTYLVTINHVFPNPTAAMIGEREAYTVVYCSDRISAHSWRKAVRTVRDRDDYLPSHA